ncbi:MAG: heme-binding domain-containing protein [Chloroflexales bacterium]|nr:heme-binding domain-containing protein [Chloroflexales bacterium]
MSRILKWGFIVLLILFVVIQFVPVWGQQTNPPVMAEPAWKSPQAREVAQRACFDCHSNETVWPIYSKIAPISWLVAYDVVKGREELNFSEWGVATRNDDEEASHEDEDIAEEIAETITDGSMPMRNYLLLHPEAQLTETEKQLLIQNFQ